MIPPRIFYYCYDDDRPRGGNRSIYRQVDILNAHGHEAYVLHTQKDVRLKWFANDTAVIDMGACIRLCDPSADYFVLPEDLGERILNFPGKKVILNQAVHNGFLAFAQTVPRPYPYLHSDVVAVLAKSEHNRKYLRFAYPRATILRIDNGIDPERYAFRPLDRKEKQIACIPKGTNDLYALVHMLHARALEGRNRLRGWRWVFVADRTEAEMAAIFSDSLFVFFLSTEEGFGRVPLEALLSGCLPVAYRTGPMREHLPEQFLFEPHDVLSVGQWVEAVVAAWPGELGVWQQRCDAGRERALAQSPRREIESVLAAWQAILAQ